MAIKTVEKLNLTPELSRGAGLCYFDPETEALTEFSSQELIYITPFEESVRRYYLVKSSAEPSVFASVRIRSNSALMDLKVSVGGIRVTAKEEFIDLEVNNSLVVFFSEFPSGIIPLDVYFKSNANKKLESNFSIKINIE